MLAALVAAVLILPFITADITGDKQAITFLEFVKNNLGAFAPDLYINGIIDVVAVFVFAFGNTACKIYDNIAAVKGL